MFPKLVLTALAALIFMPAQPVDAQRGPRYPVPVGAQHPEFKLPNVADGQPISLSQYRGKKLLLVHFASW